MSKILQEGETGYGILIESDAGYVDYNLNKSLLESLNENNKIESNKPIYINCILQKWGVENKNGRIYPKEILIPQVGEYQKLVDANSAMSESDHPDSSVVSLDNVSHGIKEMWWGKGDDQHILYGKLELIVTPGYLNLGIASMIGDKILQYLRMGYKLGISSRGIGTLKEINGQNIVQDDFELICFDLVHSPSTPGAHLYNETLQLENIKKQGTILGSTNIVREASKISENDKKLVGLLDSFLYG